MKVNKMFDLIATVRGRRDNLMHIEEKIILSSFYNEESTKSTTPYQRFREKVKDIASSLVQLFHIELSLVEIIFTNEQLTHMLPIVCMKGNIKWLDSVEFFTTYVGMGASASNASLPDAIGLIDYDKKIRIEVSSGNIYPVVQISKIGV